MKRSIAKGQCTPPEHEDSYMYNGDVNLSAPADMIMDDIWGGGNMVGTEMADIYNWGPPGSAADFLQAISLAPSIPVPHWIQEAVQTAQ